MAKAGQVTVNGAEKVAKLPEKKRKQVIKEAKASPEPKKAAREALKTDPVEVESSWANPHSVKRLGKTKRLASELVKLFSDNLDLEVSAKDGKWLGERLCDFVSTVEALHENVSDFIHEQTGE